MRQHSTCFHGGLGRKSRAAAGPPDSSRNLAIAVCRPWDCWGREPIPSGARRQFSDHACGLEERRSERAKSTRFSYILSRFFSFVLFFHQPFIFTHCCRSITLCIREWRRFDRLPGSLCLPTIPRRPVQTFAQLRTPAHRVLVPFFFCSRPVSKNPEFCRACLFAKAARARPQSSDRSTRQQSQPSQTWLTKTPPSSSPTTMSALCGPILRLSRRRPVLISMKA